MVILRFNGCVRSVLMVNKNTPPGLNCGIIACIYVCVKGIHCKLVAHWLDCE